MGIFKSLWAFLCVSRDDTPSGDSEYYEEREEKRIQTVDELSEPTFARDEQAALKYTERARSGRQNCLLLHSAKQRYAHSTEHRIPGLKSGNEVLVKVQIIGLNPIDWKAPDFGFGIPALPCISGREFVGVVIDTKRRGLRVRKGDVVIVPSTDYRDFRKSAFQEYAVATDYNACRIPSHVSLNNAAATGVAFAAASVALLVSMGMRFKSAEDGPNLLEALRELDRNILPADIRDECYDKISHEEGAREGDWLAIWGASSATALCALQLAKIAGMKVICIVDASTHGRRLQELGSDNIVDSSDPERAVEEVRDLTGGKLRFGLDTKGKATATLLLQCLQHQPDDVLHKAHLVGLTGLPKTSSENVAMHSVPIKLFHEVSTIGEILMVWLEELLSSSRISLPEVEAEPRGLEGINDALDKLRSGVVSGKRLVVPLG